MQLLLAILLYLRYIVSPATYTQTYIDTLQAQHQQEIQAVQNDPVQMDIVNRQYMEPASQVIVVQDGGND